MKVDTLVRAAELVSDDLEYLCSLVEQPDLEVIIVNAVAYSHAVMALSNQLDFLTEDLSDNELNETEEYVRLTKEDVYMLSTMTADSEDAMIRLEEECGLSLKNN